MKSAFAKLVMKDPIKSNQFDFRAGGTGVPILTRASGSSTAGFQTMGLPVNPKSILGPIRMGDDDGNGPPSAIFPGVYSQPIEHPERTYPDRNIFTTNGNNVFQPDDKSLATVALLRRLGEQQFKATSQAPFEDYLQQQKLAQAVEEASRGASLADLGTSREIVRNLAAQRRQQNEDDYLRKMLDSGATPEAARKEIEDVRNANAIQEARKVDDREYQAKTLIQRIAMSRGVTPMVKEPLNQSSSIDNPQPSQAMAQAMGMAGDGFGTSPLDANRIFMNPEFYKKFLRKTGLTQESADEQTAFNRLITGNSPYENIPVPDQGAYSFATMKGQERQNQVENTAESLAARLESIRNRSNRIYRPLPSNVVGKEFLDDIYKQKSKKAGESALFSLETIEELKPPQLLLALNFLSIERGLSNVHNELRKYTWGSTEKPSETFFIDLKKVLIELNRGELNIELPFVSLVKQLPASKFVTIIDELKTKSLAKALQDAKKEYQRYMDIWSEMISPGAEKDLSAKNFAESQAATKIQGAVRKNQAVKKDAATKIQALARGSAVRKNVKLKSEVSGAMSSLLDNVEFQAIEGYTKKELVRELEAAGLSTGGNKKEMVARLKSLFE